MYRTLKLRFSFMLTLCLFGRADACSLLFVGGDYTDDGASMFVRVEDGDLNDENKLYLVFPLAGKHKAGKHGRDHRTGTKGGYLCGRCGEAYH